MRSYNSLVGRIKNQETREVNNLAIGLQSLASTGSLSASGGGGGNVDLSSYTTKTYVDSSLNTLKTYANATYATKTYVDSSLNANYATTASLSSYASKTYVDSSINSLKTAIDNRFDLITTGAGSALDTLGEIATAIQSDASFGIHVYSRIDKLDVSINLIDTSSYATKTYVDTSLNANYLTSASLSSYATKTYVDTSLNTNYATKSYADAIRTYVDSSLNANYATTASLSSYATKTYVDSSLNANYVTTTTANSTYLKPGLTYDVSMTGNVQLGSGTKYVAINKVPGSTYALDVSGSALIAGSTLINGNLSVYKSPSDTNYSTLDMSGVNLNIFGTVEKFKTITYSGTSLSLDCVNGTIFDISGVGASITAITFTNVPATLGQSVSLTVLLRQSSSKYYFTGTTITVNSISCTFLKPDSTALAAPSNNSRVVILQFVVLWVSLTAPVVLTYMSAQG